MPALPQEVKSGLFGVLAAAVVVVDSASWFLSMAGDLVLVSALYLTTKLPVRS